MKNEPVRQKLEWEIYTFEIVDGKLAVYAGDKLVAQYEEYEIQAQIISADIAGEMWKRRLDLYRRMKDATNNKTSDLEVENQRLKDIINEMTGKAPVVTVMLKGKGYLMPESSAEAVIVEISQLEECISDMRNTIRRASNILKLKTSGTFGVKFATTEQTIKARNMLKEMLNERYFLFHEFREGLDRK